MRQSTKFLLLGLFIFLVLSGLAVVLLTTIGVGNAEASKRIAEAWGICMGVLVALIGVPWWARGERAGDLCDRF
jgi:hypothetical protein